VAVLALSGLVTSLLVSLAGQVALFGQMLAVGVGAAALAGLGWLLFPARAVDPGSDPPS